MLLKDLNEMEYNQSDLDAIKNAQPKLDKAVKAHNTLMQEIVPQRKKLQSELDDIENQEDGQGQRYDDIEELKDKIKILDDKASASGFVIDDLTRKRDAIHQMSKS